MTSLTNCTFVKLELGAQGTRFYGDAGEFDRHRGINLGIWCQWLYGHELDGGVVKWRCTARGGDAARRGPSGGRELFTNRVGNF